jgi:hypothetical protein
MLLCVSPDNVERAQWQWRQWVSYNPKLTTIVDLMNSVTWGVESCGALVGCGGAGGGGGGSG